MATHQCRVRRRIRRVRIRISLEKRMNDKVNDARIRNPKLPSVVYTIMLLIQVLC